MGMDGDGFVSSTFIPRVDETPPPFIHPVPSIHLKAHVQRSALFFMRRLKKMPPQLDAW